MMPKCRFRKKKSKRFMVRVRSSLQKNKGDKKVNKLCGPRSPHHFDADLSLTNLVPWDPLACSGNSIYLPRVKDKS